MEDRETARMRKYGESKTTRIMMATVPHVTSSLGPRKFQADGFLLTQVYLFNFSINVFIKIAGICSDFWGVVHKTELFFVIMYVYLDGLKTLSFLFVLLTLRMSYGTPLDDEYL